VISPDQVAEAVLSARSDAIVAADRDGIIRFWNPGAERIFGHTRDEAIGRSLDLIIPERLRERHWDGYRHTMATGQSRYGEGETLSVPALRADGATISVEFTVVPLKSAGGQMTGIIAVMRDASKRFEEMRTLRRKLAAAGQ
jgi:PAS domain S-box-containing protein